MQRDANLTMIKIQRKLRPASSPIIEVVSDSELKIDGDSFVLEGDEGTQFDVTSNDGVWNINFTLKRGNVQTTLRTAVKPRN